MPLHLGPESRGEEGGPLHARQLARKVGERNGLDLRALQVTSDCIHTHAHTHTHTHSHTHTHTHTYTHTHPHTHTYTPTHTHTHTHTHTCTHITHTRMHCNLTFAATYQNKLPLHTEAYVSLLTEAEEAEDWIKTLELLSEVGVC